MATATHDVLISTQQSHLTNLTGGPFTGSFEKIEHLMDEYDLPLERIQTARTKIVATVMSIAFAR